MLFRITLATLLIISSLSQIWGQRKWSLEDCLYYAYEHNLEVNAVKLEETSRYERYKQSRRELYMPYIEANAGYSMNGGRSIDPNTNEFINTNYFSNDYSINASFDIFQAFQKRNAMQASKYLHMAAKEDLRQEKFLLSFRIMTAFYNLIYNEGRVRNATEQLRIAQHNYDLVVRQIELGLKAKADRYEAEANLLTDRLSLSRAQNEQASARLTLEQEMNWDEAEELILDGEYELDVALVMHLSSDSLYEKATRVVPRIKAQAYRVEGTQKLLRVAKGRLFPTVSMNAGYSTGYYETFRDGEGNVLDFNEQIRNNNAKYVGLSMRIPILNRWSTRAQMRQQDIAFASAKNSLRIEEQELLRIIEQLMLENESLGIEYDQSTHRVELQGIAYEVAQKRYEKGLISIIELLQSKNLYAVAQNENLQTKSRLAVNQRTIEFYKGQSTIAEN